MAIVALQRDQDHTVVSRHYGGVRICRWGAGMPQLGIYRGILEMCGKKCILWRVVERNGCQNHNG